MGEAAREQRVALEAAMVKQARRNGALVLQVGSECLCVCERERERERGRRHKKREPILVYRILEYSSTSRREKRDAPHFSGCTRK